VVPFANACTGKAVRLLAVASSTKKIAAVTFFDGTRKLATVKKGVEGLYAKDWNTAKARKGKHELRATARDVAGRTFSATRTVRVCK
jgi:hypothetical protein